MLEHIKSISLRSLLLKILGLTIGAMIYSAGLNLFLVPNSIIDGGVVGIGLILAKLTSVSFSVWVVALNIPSGAICLKGWTQLPQIHFWPQFSAV